MDLTATLITVAAGVAMGAINNVAGGAGVLGFMAFERFCGLPFDIANPSTRPGAVGVGIFAWLGYLRMGLRPESRAWRMGLIAMLGAICGVLIEAQRNEVLFRSYLAIVSFIVAHSATEEGNDWSRSAACMATMGNVAGQPLNRRAYGLRPDRHRPDGHLRAASNL